MIRKKNTLKYPKVGLDLLIETYWKIRSKADAQTLGAIFETGEQRFLDLDSYLTPPETPEGSEIESESPIPFPSSGSTQKELLMYLRNTRIVELACKGVTLQELAAHHGVSTARISQIIPESLKLEAVRARKANPGISINSVRVRRTAAVCSAIVMLRQKGMSPQQISNFTKMPVSSIYPIVAESETVS